VRFEITAGLRNDAGGSWSLRVTLPDQSPHEITGLSFASPEFDKLNWVGFTSVATDTTRFFVDGFSLRGD